MKEIQLNAEVSYSDYVVQDRSIETSATLSPAITLDPQYNNRMMDYYKSLLALNKHKSASIVAYRAIAWWGTRVYWRQGDPYKYQLIVETASEMIDPSVKPKSFSVMSSELRSIE